MTKEQKAAIKKIFSNAILQVKKLDIIDESFAGRFLLNCNNGALTEVETMQRIK